MTPDEFPSSRVRLQDKRLARWGSGHGRRFTHDIFRFPGKFHPPLIRHILTTTSADAVIDPMSGVGTVAVEAKAAGIPSFSVDIDPVSVFFSRVKTTPIKGDVLENAWAKLRHSLDSYRRSEREIETRKFRDMRHDIMRKDLRRVDAADLEHLTYWFRRYVLVDYARINHSIFNGGLPSEALKTRSFFLACLLSAVRRISNADPSPVSGLEITAPMRERIENGYEIDVFAEFERRVTSAIDAMREYWDYLEENNTRATRTTVIQGDCKALPRFLRTNGFSAGLILFSPPYCNAIEYWRRHRLEYLLGGFLDESEICNLARTFIGRTTLGGRSKKPAAFGLPAIDEILTELFYGGRGHKANVLAQYFAEMQTRLNTFYECLPPWGYCIIVVGDSRTGRFRVPTTQALRWLAQKSGFSHVRTSRYKIKNRSMQFPVKPHPKISEESIIVLQRDPSI